MVKKQQYILVKVGDKDHPPSEEQLQRTANILRDSILKKKKIITFPYWVDISFVNAKPKNAFVVKHKDPVYCKNCKWGKLDCIEEVECHNPQVIKKYKQITPNEKAWGEEIKKYNYIFVKYAELNQSNDCEHFEQRKYFWQR